MFGHFLAADPRRGPGRRGRQHRGRHGHGHGPGCGGRRAEAPGESGEVAEA
jgi:hypothetical protein